MKPVIEDVFKKIQSAEVNTEPFDHLVVDSLLPDDFYKKLSQDFSNEDFRGKYARGGYGNKERVGVDITDYGAWERSCESIPTTIHENNYSTLSTRGSKNIKLFFDFLLETQAALYSTLCSKLQTEREQDNYFFHASMTKDSVGYEIKPHTDTDKNIFTILFYTPETDINKEFGLHIYKDVHNHLDARLIDFIPNRMVVFTPSEPNGERPPTWHEVRRLTDELVGTRNSFQIFFYKTRK